MKNLILIFSILLPALANADQVACFQKEIDPRSSAPYESRLLYQWASEDWRKETPSLPNPLALPFAYVIYSNEKAKAESLGSELTAHCFIGCRVAQETSVRTATYVGWFKEQTDLTDCNSDSQFQPQEQDAMVKGAEMASSLRSANECATACLQVYPKR